MTRPRSLLVAIAAVGAAAVSVPVAAAGLTFTSQTLTPYRTCTLNGYTPTSPPTAVVADATVQQGSPNTNAGTATTVNIASATGANKRVYALFNLTSCPRTIPAAATVRQATLRLYLSAVPTSCRTEDVFRVTTSWAEGSITWNNQPFGTTTNNPVSSSRSASFSVGTPVGCQYSATGYATATVTPDVQSIVNGTQSNFGWMLRDDSENAGAAVSATYIAKDLNSVALSPQLVVTYVDVP